LGGERGSHLTEQLGRTGKIRVAARDDDRMVPDGENIAPELHLV
jgi:hypothetical protein